MKNLYIVLFIILVFNSNFFSQKLKNQILREKTSSSILTPVIFLPGIMGSPLYDDENNNNKLEIDEKAWFGAKFPSMWLQSNGIDPAGAYNIKASPLRNDSLNNLRNELNAVPMDLYKGFFDNLEQNDYILDNYDNNHNQGENLFCFTYDWRKDNRTIAGLLSDFIDSVREWTGAAKINLIGHSMGGIVAKTCIKIYDKSRIDKVVFIGTPHLGAAEMMTVMLKGKLFEWLNFFVAEVSVKSLSRNLPSCYQLIPSAAYFNLQLKNNISSGVEIYSDCLQLPNGNFTNYSEMNAYLKNYKSSFNENLNSALIDSAELFKDSISFVDFGDVKVFNIVGYNIPTIGKNRISTNPPFNLITVEESRNLNGDFTVPLRSAEIVNGQIPEHTYYIPDIKHCDLPSSKQVLEILLGIFKEPPETNFPQYSIVPSSYAAPVTGIYGEKEKPETLYFYQNYPNPFNLATNFEFRTADFELVTLGVFDILGNEVAAIVNKELPAGNYKYQWDAGGFASGVYFCKIQAGSFIETKKLILMK
ncbi:MAG TPA: alpha/beta fold hydrolase [Ignavibacteriaceae bacterium]|nr:alpha/beta fold hydrolase [Ignavibacteriaceae bacterium]